MHRFLPPKFLVVHCPAENASSTMSPPAPIVRLPSSESEAVAFPSYDHQQDDSADRALKDKQTYSLNSLAATTAAVVGDRGTGGEIGVAGDETWCASGGENPRISAATEGGDRAETVPKERKRVLAATGSCGVGAEAEAAEGCAEIVDVDAGDRHGSGDKRRHPAHDKVRGEWKRSMNCTVRRTGPARAWNGLWYRQV